MTAKINESQPNWQPRKWIVPPGLEQILQKFDTRAELIIEKFFQNKNQPLMIHGPTGVGKSMFTEYFIHKFRNVTNNKTVIYLNCAAIPSELLESELFGYEIGAHSTATVSKAGYLEIANDGVIIFEEIGEMTRPLQAKLLMAIETKIFSKLGSTEQINFKAQIIATTNAKQESFREDFWFRFNIFSVPPIHERRIDILYYMEHFDSDIMKYLTRGVVLSVLSYNWPGNVREIERVCLSIRENIINLKKNPLIQDRLIEKIIPEYSFHRLSAIMHLDKKVSGFRFDKAQQFVDALLKGKINVRALDNFLQENKLSFDCLNPLFFSNPKSNRENTTNSAIDATDNHLVRPHNTTYLFSFFGLQQFCRIFFQDINANADILDLTSTFTHKETPKNEIMETFTCDKKYTQKSNFSGKTIGPLQEHINPFIFLNNTIHKSPLYLNFSKIDDNTKSAIIAALKFLTKLQTIEDSDIENLYDLFKKNKSNKFLSYYFDSESKAENIEEIPIEYIAYSDIKELYYETLCNKIGLRHGSQKRIAEIAQFSTGTISQDFTELKIKEKFSDPNFPPRKRLVFLK